MDYKLKTQSKSQRAKEIQAIFDHAIFPSDEEEDTLEHLDMGLKEFEDLIKELVSLVD